jgi:hypothetical protein
VRYCPPPPRGRPSWCARIAEWSAELGSLAAVWDRLDEERAAAVALGQARRDQAAMVVEHVAWLAEGERRFREWLAAPLQVPDGVDGQGWPEPGDGWPELGAGWVDDVLREFLGDGRAR